MTNIIRQNNKINEEQINQIGLKILKEVAPKKEERKKEESKMITFDIREMDVNMRYSKTYDSVCHSWFIVKELGMEINWKTPLVQRSQIRSYIKIA